MKTFEDFQKMEMPKDLKEIFKANGGSHVTMTKYFADNPEDDIPEFIEQWVAYEIQNRCRPTLLNRLVGRMYTGARKRLRDGYFRIERKKDEPIEDLLG